MGVKSTKRGIPVEDTLVKQAMLRQAKDIIAVVDSSKFGQDAFTAIAPLKAVNCIITDSGLEPKMADRIREIGIEMVLL